MDAKLALICVLLVVLAVQDMVQAEFLFNRVFPKQEELENVGLKCIPGRTVIRIQEKYTQPEETENDSDEYLKRRSHMRFHSEEESCQVCVCSVEGKDEYCSKRPAINVNECMRMANLMQRFQKNDPYDHERTLSYRIRRDYIWHDETPDPSYAKCKRSHSYYSNSINANDTDLDVASDIHSLLDYSNTSICFYCICTASGDGASCIPRNPWICQYFRNIRDPSAARDRYRILFQQDRPAYFRQLSYRLRRTMDEGIFELIENVGEGLENKKCTPFVSIYTDCTRENVCDGCKRCSCSAEGAWDCETFSDCSAAAQREDIEDEVDEQGINSAMKMILEEINQGTNAKSKNGYVSDTIMSDSQLTDQVLDVEVRITTESGSIIIEEEDALLSLLRDKRSVDTKDIDGRKENGTVIFHHTIDEVNEDTLNKTGMSGTLHAPKIEAMPQVSRRSSLSNNLTSKSLQIEYTPPIHNQHATDNKVDTPAIHDDQVDLMVHHKIYEIAGNQSQVVRDKDLSKIVVNELKGGESEVIGDKNSSVISNITFTAENDTLTAIAFIAGSLLNKLWNMEKDTSDSLETENIKHNKINDLLELFKEPLNLRQETFLKNALERLSTAIENKDIENVALCQNIEELKKISGLTDESNQPQVHKEDNMEIPEKETSKPDIYSKTDKFKQKANTAALSKITDVLDLIKKYENVHNSLTNIKSKPNLFAKPNARMFSGKNITDDEKITLDIFGSTLETLTRLLLPSKKSKKLVTGIKSKNSFNNGNNNIRDKLKNLNLTDTITTKDRIVLDYLNHIQNSPNCLLNKAQEKTLPLKIQGDILLNLSEFFKIKSMSDLLKLVDSDKEKKPVLRKKPTLKKITESEPDETTETNTQTTPKDKHFDTTKEKLKGHLKTILEDLIELQKINGNPTNAKDIQIAEVFPCIYNLFNINRNSNNTVQTKSNPKEDKFDNPAIDSVNKVTEVFNKLKKELKHTSLTRRTNVGIGPRPKSAIVWERTIKNLNAKHKLETRRNIESNDLRSIEDVRKIVDEIENSGSNTYKSVAYLTEVPPAERLLLLKTLAVDTKKYISALKDIRRSIEASNNLQIEQYKIISEFIDNVNININLNRNILNKLDKPRKNIYVSNQEVGPTKTVNIYKTTKGTEMSASRNKAVTLSRDQILNQLIKNRMNYYLKMKEATGNVRNNINKDLAKRILLYLDIGNDNLARELYKLFVAQNKKKPMNMPNHQDPDPVKPAAFNQQRFEKIPPRVPIPLIQFEEPTVVDKDLSWLNQEQLIKQLVNIKNMKV